MTDLRVFLQPGASGYATRFETELSSRWPELLALVRAQEESAIDQVLDKAAIRRSVGLCENLSGIVTLDSLLIETQKWCLQRLQGLLW